jgi:hypothetical protein
LLMSSYFIIAGWKWTNNIPSNTRQQYVMVVKKSTRSGEKLIYGILLLLLAIWLPLKSLTANVSCYVSLRRWPEYFLKDLILFLFFFV